jgi:hypothetical protein
MYGLATLAFRGGICPGWVEHRMVDVEVSYHQGGDGRRGEKKVGGDRAPWSAPCPEEVRICDPHGRVVRVEEPRGRRDVDRHNVRSVVVDHSAAGYRVEKVGQVDRHSGAVRIRGGGKGRISRKNR